MRDAGIAGFLFLPEKTGRFCLQETREMLFRKHRKAIRKTWKCFSQNRVVFFIAGSNSRNRRPFPPTNQRSSKAAAACFRVIPEPYPTDRSRPGRNRNGLHRRGGKIPAGKNASHRLRSGRNRRIRRAGYANEK